MSMPPSVPHASSAVSTIFAPAPTYSPSSICEPTPAFFSMKTSWPWATSSWTPIGVMATRYSWFLTSLGTPTFTQPTLVPGGPAADQATGVGGQHCDQHRRIVDPAVQAGRQELVVRHPQRLHVGLLVDRLEVTPVRLTDPPREEVVDLL